MDYKAKVDERIKSELPELAKKTTYLLFGYYPQNLLLFPMLKPFEYVSFAGEVFASRTLLTLQPIVRNWLSYSSVANGP